jgi:hypothetical protein
LTAFDLEKQQGIKAGEIDPLSLAIVSAWNLADGVVVLADIEPLAELVGIQDLEILLAGINTIRRYKRKPDAHHAET